LKNRSKHARIRTITMGLPGLARPDLVAWAGAKLKYVRDAFIELGFEVQSRRIALDHWDLGTTRLARRERESLFKALDRLCSSNEIDFCSIGTTRHPADIESMADLLSTPSRLSASAQIGASGKGIDREAIAAAARAIGHLASTPNGFGNFGFAAGSFISPGTPFFPCSYHDGGPPSFAIGLENSGLLVEAFQGASTDEIAMQRLQSALNDYCGDVVETANRISSQIEIPFKGMDTSIAPSLKPEESIALAFSARGIEFGAPGTLALCGAITSAVKSVAVPQVGYCGIMLPVLEDVGLAKASDQNRFGIVDLLAYSSVCGVGLDMIAVAGDIPVSAIENLLLDLTTISIRLAKPLSARILPSRGLRAGDMTGFDSPYICNSRVMAL
jgi:uncharacterized protein (UPF0210 family)